LFNIFCNKDKSNLKKIDELEEAVKDLELQVSFIDAKIKGKDNNKTVIDLFYSNEKIYLDKEPWWQPEYKYEFNLLSDGSIVLNEALKDSSIKTTSIKKEDVKLLLTLLDCNREILGE